MVLFLDSVFSASHIRGCDSFVPQLRTVFRSLLAAKALSYGSLTPPHLKPSLKFAAGRLHTSSRGGCGKGLGRCGWGKSKSMGMVLLRGLWHGDVGWSRCRARCGGCSEARFDVAGVTGEKKVRQQECCRAADDQGLMSDVRRPSISRAAPLQSPNVGKRSSM